MKIFKNKNVRMGLLLTGVVFCGSVVYRYSELKELAYNFYSQQSVITESWCTQVRFASIMNLDVDKIIMARQAQIDVEGLTWLQREAGYAGFRKVLEQCDLR